MLSGVPAHVDGRMLEIARAAGANEINGDRMWHYVEGIRNWDPIWPMHAIRIIPGPSSLWFDAAGRRLPGPLYPGFDTLGTLRAHPATGHDYTWFVLTQKIIEKEFALSGSEQNPDTTSKSMRAVLKERLGSGPPSPVQAFMDHGEDFIVERTLPELVRRMNALTGEDLIDLADLEAQIVARDREVANPYSKDGQITAIHGARAYFADRITRVAAPHRILDPDAGPLIAVRLSILTRKSLGGLQTDLDAPRARAGGDPLPGPLRRRRGGRLRRRRHARLPRAGGHVPGRLPVLRAGRRPGLERRHRLTDHPSNGACDPSRYPDRGAYSERMIARIAFRSGTRSRAGSSTGPRSSSWGCSSSSSGAR